MDKISLGTIPIHQGFDEDYLRVILTRDISPTEAVYDLVDNAIDAARNDIFQKGLTKKDKFGLPAIYTGYKIALRITPKSVSISDNCNGIARDELTLNTFIIGRSSSHLQGIGHFGVGLKRSMLALGRTYGLKSNTSDFAAQLRFTAADLSIRDNPLVGELIVPRPRARTTISITDLEAGPLHEFGDDIDLSLLRTRLGQRYGIFIKKGIQITVNGSAIDAIDASVRARAPISPKRLHGNSGNVSFFVEAGMHNKYRAPSEPDHSMQENGKIADRYGWYIVCNDRVIELASKEKKHGFSADWHPEYNGFVGWVHFVSDDPADLPWNTKKTEIDVNSAPFRAAVGTLRELSDDFRRENRKLKKATSSPSKNGTSKSASTKSTKAGGGSNQNGSKAASQSKTGGIKTQTTSVKIHANDWIKLIPPIEFGWKDAKLESLLAEAEELDLSFSYSGCALLRMIIERAVDQHIRKSGTLSEIKQMVVDKQLADGRDFTDEQKANFEPTLSTMFEWLKKNNTFFPEEVRSECVQSINKFSNALSKTINGAMHKNVIVSDQELKEIRNQVYPLLEYLISTDPTRKQV
ncbi:MAG: ATP-binding protein [Methylococcales bacterium]